MVFAASSRSISDGLYSPSDAISVSFQSLPAGGMERETVIPSSFVILTAALLPASSLSVQAMTLFTSLCLSRKFVSAASAVLPRESRQTSRLGYSDW